MYLAESEVNVHHSTPRTRPHYSSRAVSFVLNPRMHWIASPRPPAIKSYGHHSIVPNCTLWKTAGQWSKTIVQHRVTILW